MLMGKSDTGKTVLVRNLAWELNKTEEHEIYHFSCNVNRDFDHARLAARINGMKGIIIIRTGNLLVIF